MARAAMITDVFHAIAEPRRRREARAVLGIPVARGAAEARSRNEVGLRSKRDGKA